MIITANTCRNKNVIITSKRRRFDVMMTLLLRRVSAGMAFRLDLSVRWKPKIFMMPTLLSLMEPDRLYDHNDNLPTIL